MIGICSVIKNEHRYLKEWLDYHFSIGIEHIWLFEDYGSQSHSDIIKEYSDKVTLFPFSITGAIEGDTSRQCVVYEWFCREYKDKMDWCAFIDIDEFIVLEEGWDLDTLCKQFKNASLNGFVLYWKLFDANGHIKCPEGKVRDCYTHPTDLLPVPNKDLCICYKTVCNMHKDIAIWINCHATQKICDTLGNHVDINMRKNTRIFDRAYLAHYFTKSWEDWEKRLSRGNIAAVNRNVDMFFHINPDMLPMKEKLISEVIQ